LTLLVQHTLFLAIALLTFWRACSCVWLLPLLLLLLLLLLPLLMRAYSPLHYAACGGHAHIVRKLLGATTASDRLLLQGCTDNYDRCAVATSVQVQTPADVVPSQGAMHPRTQCMTCSH
jgi:hypothetical protein